MKCEVIGIQGDEILLSGVWETVPPQFFNLRTEKEYTIISHRASKEDVYGTGPHHLYIDNRRPTVLRLDAESVKEIKIGDFINNQK